VIPLSTTVISRCMRGGMIVVLRSLQAIARSTCFTMTFGQGLYVPLIVTDHERFLEHFLKSTNPCPVTDKGTLTCLLEREDGRGAYTVNMGYYADIYGRAAGTGSAERGHFNFKSP